MDFPTFVNETFHKLARQGEQSITARTPGNLSGCLYNGPRGTHCAIGFWLTSPVKEGMSVNAAEIVLALPDWMRQFNWNYLRYLQHVHDAKENWQSPHRLINAMKSYAVAHGVIFDPTIEAEVWANWKGNPPLVDPVMPALPVPEPAKMSYFSSSTPYGSPVSMSYKLYDTTA